MILLLRKDHPIVPLNRAMEQSLFRIGVVRNRGTHDRREKRLHELLKPEQILAFHHYLLQHSRETCPPDETELQCASCQMRRVCNYYAALNRKARAGTNSAKGVPKPLSTQRAARKRARSPSRRK
jgi:hypothetical protein